MEDMQNQATTAPYKKTCRDVEKTLHRNPTQWGWSFPMATIRIDPNHMRKTPVLFESMISQLPGLGNDMLHCFRWRLVHHWGRSQVCVLNVFTCWESSESTGTRWEKQVVSQSEFAPFNMCFPTLDIQIFAVYKLDDIRVPCISRRTKTLVPWWICSEVVLPPAIQISLGIVLHNPSPGRLRGWWVDWLKISRFVWDVVDHLEGSMLSILLPKLKRSSDFLGLEKPVIFFARWRLESSRFAPVSEINPRPMSFFWSKTYMWRIEENPRVFSDLHMLVADANRSLNRSLGWWLRISVESSSR